MVVAAASPSSEPPSAGRPHPTYKEMVVQALTELRDPSGSSRRAIASYIADHFSGLHTSHDALLSVHLRRLRSQGQLRLVSGNYFLSTAAPAPQQQRRGRGRPPKPKPTAAPGPKRGRGRPRKNADLGPSAPIPIFQGPKRGRGRPPKTANALVPVPSSASPLQGAVAPPPPSGVKRGRGRPRKNSLVLVASSSSPLIGAIAPPPSGVKRGRGRPRKNALQVVSSSSPLPLAIAPPPPSGVKRGRGRPRKNSYPLASPLLGVEQGPGGRPQRNTTIVSLLSAAMPRGGKHKPGQPPKGAVALGVVRGSSVNIYATSNSVFGAKRGRGRPPKVLVAGKRKRGRPPKEKKQPETVQSVDSPSTKRGPGRPRKEKTLENGLLQAAQMTEGGHEALPTQATPQAGAVQNEVEARNLQSFGTSLSEKRGRGRPRKRPLETEPAETGVAALVAKRGRGRPRKENPSAGSSAETSASMGIKRGPGRPRKAKPFETGFAETAVEVSTDLTEGRPEKDGDLASGKKAESEGVFWGEGDGPADTGPGEEAVIAPKDAGGAPVDSNVGTKSH